LQNTADYPAGSDEGLDLATGAPAILAAPPHSTWDDWTVAAEVQRARLLLSGSTANTSAGWRIDAHHFIGLNSPQAGAEPLRHDDVSIRRSRPRPPQNWRSLTAISAGIVIFGGGILLASSPVDRLANVARFGIPLMLFGLFWLAMGVLLLLNRLRRENRTALDRMRLLDLRLQEYRQAALLAGPSPCNAQIMDYRRLPGTRLNHARFEAVDPLAAKDF
jgi:hypothetical protein